MDIPPVAFWQDMGISFKIDSDEGIIYALAEGTIRPEDVHAFRKNLLADPNFSPDLVTIVEYQLASIKLTDGEVRYLVADLLAVHPRKVAIVSSEQRWESALRYKDLVKEEILVEVFTDFGSAKKWITSD